MKKPKLIALVFAAAFALGIAVFVLSPQPTWAEEYCDYYYPNGGFVCYYMYQPPQECSCGPGYMPGYIWDCCEGLNYDAYSNLTIPCRCAPRCLCKKAAKTPYDLDEEP
jgi:hypothetical protein